MSAESPTPEGVPDRLPEPSPPRVRVGARPAAPVFASAVFPSSGESLAEAVLASLSMSVLVIDRQGRVLWNNAGEPGDDTDAAFDEGAGDPRARPPGRCSQDPERWPGRLCPVGSSYFSDCLLATACGDGVAYRVLTGVLDVLCGRAREVRSELATAADRGERRFAVLATPLAGGGGAVLVHQEIAPRTAVAPGGIEEGAPEPGGDPACAPAPATQARCDAPVESVNPSANPGAAACAEAPPGLLHRAGQGRSAARLRARARRRRPSGTGVDPSAAVAGVGARPGAPPTQGDASGVLADIESLREEARRLHYLAHHDSLTGLANRLLFWARLEQAIERAGRHGRRGALLFLDLDRFKEVNDTLGHAAGDQVLKTAATRVREAVRQEDTVARIGGDELAVILEEIGEPQDAVRIARKLSDAIAEPMVLSLGGEPGPGAGTITLRIGASIGIAFFPGDATQREALFKAADTAMYRAKVSRTAVCCFDGRRDQAPGDTDRTGRASGGHATAQTRAGGGSAGGASGL